VDVVGSEGQDGGGGGRYLRRSTRGTTDRMAAVAATESAPVHFRRYRKISTGHVEEQVVQQQGRPG